MAGISLLELTFPEPSIVSPFAGQHKRKKICKHASHMRDLSVVAPDASTAHTCHHCEDLLTSKNAATNFKSYTKKNKRVSQVYHISRGTIENGASQGCLLFNFILDRTYYAFDDEDVGITLEVDYTMPPAFTRLAIILMRAEQSAKNDVKFLCWQWESTTADSAGIVAHLREEENLKTPSDERSFRTAFKGAYAPVMEAFATENDPAARNISNRPRNGSYRDVASAKSLEHARTWLSDCHNKHKKCSHRSNLFLPTRVLDISSPRPQVYITRANERGDYAALSYCWGGPQTPMTTSKNIQEMVNGLETASFSQSIQDAIFITRELGLRFLWVDALCILQDSNEDKAKEITNMPNIYKNALVTITGASASVAKDGFLGVRGIPCEQLDAFKLPYNCSSGEKGTIVIAEYAIYSEDDEPINSRGWTMQETLVSQRTLTFDTYGMRWSCLSLLESHGSYINEFFDDDLAGLRDPTFFDDSPKIKVPKDVDFLEQWRLICETYSSRKLTEPGDKLLAMSAIASSYKKIFRDDYYAGLWRRYLALDLLWYRLDSEPARPRPRTYRAPSWSWTSIDSPIQWDPDHTGNWDDIKTKIKILDVRAEIEQGYNEFGAIRSALLTVQGRVAELLWCEDGKTLKGRNGDPGLNFFLSTMPDTSDDLDAVKGRELVVTCLEVVKPFQEGLVLGATKETKRANRKKALKSAEKWRNKIEPGVVEIA
ncbi:hypothetical protein N0V90_010497 [Kalmusia sp. IMI 367209]|nr:hypothetical protein N0V90_010497 [Kalmusia sp. IMI 367209]